MISSPLSGLAVELLLQFYEPLIVKYILSYSKTNILVQNSILHEEKPGRHLKTSTKTFSAMKE
jgi:hypothetical protein